MQRRGKWIWRDRGVPFGRVSPKLDTNLFAHFRRAFTLDAPQATAPVRVSADGRYKLYVNGTYVGRGPARCEPLFQYYDEYDIAPHLRPGTNVIAALVHSYGRDLSWYEMPSKTRWGETFGCGGFFLECDGVDRIDSDAAWRYTLAEAWERDTTAGAVGFVESYDARKAIDGWQLAQFDDTQWDAAFVLETPGIGHSPAVVPFPHMVARDIPPLREEPRAPTAFAGVYEVVAPDAADMLGIAEARAEPLGACSTDGLDRVIARAGAGAITLATGRALAVVLDFGRDVSGHPRFDVEGVAGTIVDISYSERLREDGRCEVQRPNPITSQNVHRYVMRDGRQSWEKFDRAGFRYLQLTFIPSPDAAASNVLLHTVDVNFTSYPVGDRGAFACSDDTLTRIWRTGAYTLQLCMQDGFEDCPSREQRQWVGDAYVESLVNYACFGDTKLTAKLLRQAAQSQMRDGMTQMATPGDVAARFPLYIVDYCLAWIMTAGEYVLHTGDTATVSAIFPSVVRAVEWFERHVGDEGLLVEPPGWIFIDWAEVDRRGACTALNALYVQALGHAAAIAEREQADTLAARWRAIARTIGDALNARCWDETRGAYVDAWLSGDGESRRVSQHANAVMIEAGIAPRERWDRMLDYVTDDARLVATSTSFGGPADTVAIDEERQVVLAQPFFMHHVHRALVAAGRTHAIIENIRTRWSPMLDVNGTDTLWEHWHGRESRCHAWSVTPTYDLSREVLGVRPLEPGFARYRVEPAPGALTWAQGRYPSVKGDITVSWRIEDDAYTLDLDSPPDTTADVSLPPGVEDVRLNGSPHGEPLIEGLSPGRWRIEARL